MWGTSLIIIYQSRKCAFPYPGFMLCQLMYSFLSVCLQEGSPGKELTHRQSPMGLKEVRTHDRPEGQSSFKEGLSEVRTWSVLLFLLCGFRSSVDRAVKKSDSELLRMHSVALKQEKYLVCVAGTVFSIAVTRPCQPHQV